VNVIRRVVAGLSEPGTLTCLLPFTYMLPRESRFDARGAATNG
jgi:hypothetical protein